MDYIADIRAIDALEELVFKVKDRPFGSNAGFGVYHGPSGFGKSTATIAVQARFSEGDILIATGQEHWKSSAKGMLHDLLKACEYIAPNSWSLGQLQNELIARLSALDTTLIIDEADKACSGRTVKLMEVLRDILDALGNKGRIILVGEEDLPTKICEERQYNRVTEFTAVPTINRDDVAKILKRIDLCIDPDVLEELAKLQQFRIRALFTAVQRIQEWANVNGIAKVTREHWDDMPKLAPRTVRAEFLK